MMFALRIASLGALTLLLGSTKARPMPHHPQYGEIVHVAPDQTSGGSVGTGGSIPHPHVALGHVGNGFYAVAPVTHNSGSDHLKPHMPTPQSDTHNLGGVTRLDHVVAHHSAISRSFGQHANTNIGVDGAHDIQSAKGLVGMHHQAANAHDGASHAFRQMENHHSGLSAHHFATGNAALGQHHDQQATHYRTHADNHATAATHHRQAAHDVNGPDAAQHAHAQNSFHHANQAHASLNAAVHHEQQAHLLSQVHPHAPGAAQAHADAAWHAQQPAIHRANAVVSSGHAMTAHGHATGH